MSGVSPTCVNVSLSLRLKDLLGPVTRVKKKLRGAYPYEGRVSNVGERVALVKGVGFSV